MQYQFDKHLKELLPVDSAKILVAVSGGADSMCLLDLLYNSSLDLDIAIAHVNFNLRGAESDADEVLVREWARVRSVKCYVNSVDTLSYARERALSIEMAARELRYAWFARLRKEYGFRYVAVAHHANDNAETLLLNLVRGTGIKGICGMKEVDIDSCILRPLLKYTREEIEKQVAKRSIPFRTDRTNLEPEFYRNRIRNLVMPQLKQINASVTKTLNRDIGHFADAAGILEEVMVEKMEQLCLRECQESSPFLDGIKNNAVKQYLIRVLTGCFECALSIEALLKEKHYRYWLYECLVQYGFSPARIEDLACALEEGASKIFVSESHVAVIERGFVKIYKGMVLKSWDPVLIEVFTGKKEFHAADLCISLYITDAADPKVRMPYADNVNLSGTTLTVSADHLRFPLVCRSVQVGDKWRPFGMKGVKKLSDYLTDIKMDRILKSRTAVLCNGEQINNPDSIVCLPGLQIGDFYKVTDQTKRVLIITVNE